MKKHLKSFKYFLIIWSVLFVLFNAITFIVPNNIWGESRFEKPIFWIAYALIVGSFVGQFFTFYIFSKTEVGEKMFLSIPLIKIGYVGIFISFVVGTIFMIVTQIPAWIGAVVCLLILAFLIIATVNAITVSNTVSGVSQKIKDKTSFYRSALIEIEDISYRCTTAEMKNEVQRICENLRYSDSVSYEALSGIEDEIYGKIKDLRFAVTNANIEEVKSVVQNLNVLIKKRNLQAKSLKSGF